MPLVNDRDLLLLEPAVFVQALDAATLVISVGDANVNGTSVISSSSNFTAAGVGFGHAAVVAGEPCEVVSREFATELRVSRPRADEADPLIPLAAGTAQTLLVPTFERVIAQAESWTFGALGIDPDDPVRPLDDTAIVNVDEVARVVALRALRLAFAAVAAQNPADAARAHLAGLYELRERQARSLLRALIDTDGDGFADATRRIGAAPPRRA